MTAAVPAAAATATSRDRLPPLDGLRGLCAVAIVVTHVAFQSGDAFRGLWGGPLSRLGVGRALLFLLSGFLLYQAFARSSLLQRPGPATAPYLWRRFLRIMPAYWVMMTALVVVLHPGVLREPATLLQQAVLAQTLTPGGILAGSEPTWSLSVEAAFYLALPILALAAGRLCRGAADPRGWARRQLAFCGLLAAASLGWKLLRHGTDLLPDHAVLWLPYQLDLFALGMAFAVVVVHRGADQSAWPRLRQVASAPGTCLAAAAALYWLTCTDLAGPRSLVSEPDLWSVVARQLLYAACAAVLLLPVVLGRTDSGYARLLGTSPLRYLGRISYGVFLWHVPVLTVTARLSDHTIFSGGFWALLLPTLAVSVVLADVSYRLVEAPAMRLRQLVGRREPARAGRG